MWEAIVCISWVSFSVMRYHSLRHFPVPPCHYRYIYIYIYIPESVSQTLKVSLIGLPIGIVVRGGESERGRYANLSGRALERLSHFGSILGTIF